MDKLRVVVLTSSEFGTASRCLPELLASERIEVVGVVLAGGVPNSAALRRRKLRKIRKIGLLGALNGVRIRSWFRGEPTEHIEVLCGRLNVPLFLTDSVGSQKTVGIFSEAHADLGISLGNGYIPKRVFSLPRFGMINVHGERLPEYRNAQSVIWPIYNSETTSGLTIHEIDDTIDGGRILYKQEYAIDFHPALRETVVATSRLTGSKVAAAVRHVCEDFDRLRGHAVEQSGGQSYTTPTLRQFLRMSRNNRRLYRSTASGPSVARARASAAEQEVRGKEGS